MPRNAISASTLVGVALWMLLPAAAPAQEPVDWVMVNKIRDEGLHRSQVMSILEHLADEIGPRLTGSPQMKEANEWTRQQLADWGLEDARLEGYEFGRGWSFSRASVHMLSPRQMPLLALPVAWTPGTGKKGVRGEAEKVEIESEKDFDKYRGKLAGKILFFDDSRELQDAGEPALQRFSGGELDELEVFEIPGDRRPSFRERGRKRWRFSRKLNDFLVEEKALAKVEISSRDGGLVRLGGGGSREPGGNPGIPSLVMAAEHYNWIVRLLDTAEDGDGESSRPPVELEIEVAARFHDRDTQAYNTVAEIPGSGPGLVMAGAHLDSWHAGTGATDNAAGCAVVMEAVRILKALGVEPRRTIRVALWSGEEQGLLGSRAFVSEHLGTVPVSDDPKQQDLPEWMRDLEGEVEVKPDHETFSAYFNLDNGSGRIRGIWAQENAAVVPIFEAWLQPFHDLGADTVTTRNTRGTDHQSYDRVGLPGFQFIQDGLDYRSRTHHTNFDVLDHVVREDLMQASVVMASFLYHAAMRDEPLPRKPMPRYETEDKPALDEES